jgi:hypothetical protein
VTASVPFLTLVFVSFAVKHVLADFVLQTSDNLKTDLCNLTCIFVYPDESLPSWGKWEDTNHGQGNSFIAIRKGNTKNDLDVRLDKKQGNHLVDLNLPAGVINATSHNDHLSDADLKRLSLLYILAHEMAHIKWRKAISLFGSQLSNSCTVDQFIQFNTNRSGGSWSDPGNVTMRRFIGFADEVGQRANSVPAPSAVSTAQHLQTIYTKGMVTALGDLNAAEDFVEVYAIGEIALLTNSLNYNLDININGMVINVLLTEATAPGIRFLSINLPVSLPSCNESPLLQSR